MTKAEFLTKYNSLKSIEIALSKSISASVQHNKLYSKDLDNKQKKVIRDYWKEELRTLYLNFVDSPWGELEHNHKIIQLKDAMNIKFINQIDFRISHSQKSISVFFKHLWCLDLLSVAPPQCPIDRVILTRIGLPIRERKWGYVNTIEDHKQKIDLVKNHASIEGYNCISEWELFNFNV